MAENSESMIDLTELSVIVGRRFSEDRREESVSR